MKKISKLLALMMCLTLVVGNLAGCSKSEKDVIQNSVSKINNAKNFEMETTMTGKMTISVTDVTQSVDIDMKTNATYFVDPIKVKTSATVTTTDGEASDATAKMTNTTDSYMTKDGDDLVMYTKTDVSDWTKIKMENAASVMQSSGDMSKQLSEDSTKYVKKDDQTEHDKTYNVYEYTVSVKENQDMMKELMTSLTGSISSVMDEKEIKELLDTIILSMDDIKMTIWFDSEEENIYKITYSMTDMMNQVLEGVMSKIKETASSDSDASEDLSAALADTSITVKDMNMTCVYKNVDSAADFEIPDEALKAQELTSDLPDDLE